MLYKLRSKDYPYQKIIVDQFCLPGVYYNYLRDAKEKVTNITFLTKAEDKNLSVAAASIISRYVFLEEKEKLEKKLGMEVYLGAGSKVDECAKEIVKKYGMDYLKDISKFSFKNTEKIK